MLLETNDKRTEMCAVHTPENCAKSADHNVPYWEAFNRPVVKLQFHLQKVEQKNPAVLKMGSPLWNRVSFITSDVIETTLRVEECVPNTISWYSSE